MGSVEDLIRMKILVDRFVKKHSRLPTEIDSDYLEMLQMSKYLIEDVPQFQPGKCANCGASKNDGRRYVDFGLMVDWYGTVYLCGECLHDIVNAMGLFDNLVARVVEAESKEYDFKALQAQGVELHERVNQLVKDLEAFYAGIYPIGDDSTSNPHTVLESDKTVSDPGTEESESRINATKSRTTESTSSTRRQNIPSLADLLKSDY